MLRKQMLDDLAQMAGGTIGIANSVRRQIREEIKCRVDEMAGRLDLVPRQDLEDLEAMVQKMRLQQAEINKKLEAFEKTPARDVKKSKKKTSAKEDKS